MLNSVITHKALKCVCLSNLGGESIGLALMMTALNTWHANANFTAQSRLRPRGRALVVRTTLVGAVKGASATAQQWPRPTSPTSISYLDRSVQQHITAHAHTHVVAALTHWLKWLLKKST